jgi:glycosyltransferase involved in cell wall biosynthesis
MERSIQILHMDSALTWGGGQSQISTLIRESKRLPLRHHLASPQGSKLYAKVRSDLGGFVPLSRNLFAGLVSLVAIRNYCLKNEIQIIHAHCGKSHTFAYWLKRIFLPNIILVVHRRIPAKIRSNMLSQKKFLDPVVNHFVSVSNYIKGVLMSAGVESNRVSTIRSSKKKFPATSSDKSNARATLLRTHGVTPNGEFFILSASRLVPDKGLFILIEAFRKFVRLFPQARLLIAGEGELEEALKVAAKSLSETGHISFMGFRKDVPELLLGADIFVIPSLSEGLGSTIVEAMFARTTVIGSSVEGIPELIQHGKTGILVPPADPTALCEAFLRLAENPEERANLAAQAHTWAQEACGAEIMVQKTFDLYKVLVSHSPSTPMPGKV